MCSHCCQREFIFYSARAEQDYDKSIWKLSSPLYARRQGQSKSLTFFLSLSMGLQSQGSSKSSCGGKGPSMSTHQPPAQSLCVPHTYTTISLSYWWRKWSIPYIFPCPFQRGHCLLLSHASFLLQKGTGQYWLPPLSIRPHSWDHDGWPCHPEHTHFLPHLDLSQLQALPPQQSTRHSMLSSQWPFGIWIPLSADSQFYPSTSLESLACKNRGNTVTDIFRKGMHM